MLFSEDDDNDDDDDDCYHHHHCYFITLPLSICQTCQGRL